MNIITMSTVHVNTHYCLCFSCMCNSLYITVLHFIIFSFIKKLAWPIRDVGIGMLWPTKVYSGQCFQFLI